MKLSPEREEALFADALALPASDRAAFLAQACGDNPGLQARLAALLAAHDTPETVLKPPELRPTLSPEELPGSRIDRYLLIEKIGEGGCGTVYLAEQQEPIRRKVAIKVIKLGMDSVDVVARFEAERQTLALMDHPNIANVLDAGATRTGRPYFVMELVTGKRITTFCDENQLSLAQRLELFVAVCHAIQHAHQKGIIHRDIKPSNILVTQQDGRPVPKVIDFGIAKATHGRLNDRTVLTAIAQFVGTPVYMSPEQAEFSGRDIDTRSDIYSLGVLLYELIAGRPPFDPNVLLEAGLDEIRRQIREVEPPRPSTRLSTLTDADRATIAERRGTEPTRLATLLRSDLDWIVMRCLEKDRARRYDTANGLADDVQRHLNHEPVSASPPSTVYRLHKLVLRHKAFFAAAAVVMFALLVGTVVSTWQMFRARRAEQLASERMHSELAARQDADRQRQVAVDQSAAATAAQHEAEKHRQLAETRLQSETAARRDSEEQRSRAEQERSRAQIAEKSAQAEAMISKAVSDFLQEDLLRQVDSRIQATAQVTPDPNLTVREALDRAAGKVGVRFREKPLVEAGIREAIGQAYLGLGISDRAAEHFERAAELKTKELGPEHVSTLTARHLIGSAYVKQKRLSEAATVLEATLAARRRVLDPESPEILNTMNSLALVYLSQRRANEALALLEPMLEIQRRVFGPDSQNTLTAACNLATLYQSVNRTQEATALFEKTLEAQEKVLGRDHPDVIGTMGNLASICLTAGRSDDAARLFERVVEVRKRILGPTHPDTMQSMNELAASYRHQGRLDASATLLEEVAETQRRTLNSEHPDTLNTLSNLGCTYWAMGRREEATTLFAETARGEKKVLSVEHPDTIRSMSNLAGAYSAMGRYDDAAPILDETLTARRRVFGPKHRGTYFTAKDLGAVYLRQRKFAAAEDLLLRQCYENLGDAEVVTTLGSSRETQELEIAEMLAELYSQWGNEEEYRRWQTRERSLRRMALGWNEMPLEQMLRQRQGDAVLSRSVQAVTSSSATGSSTTSRTGTGQSSSSSTTSNTRSTSNRSTSSSTASNTASTAPSSGTVSTPPGTAPATTRPAGFTPTPPDGSSRRYAGSGSGTSQSTTSGWRPGSSSSSGSSTSSSSGSRWSGSSSSNSSSSGSSSTGYRASSTSSSSTSSSSTGSTTRSSGPTAPRTSQP